MTKKKIDITKIEQDIKKLAWKKFLHYKVLELGIIPLSILIIWKIPLLLGKLLINIFNMSPNNPLVCKLINAYGEKLVCDGINYGLVNTYLLGLESLILLGVFIGANIGFANRNAKEEILNKNNLYERYNGDFASNE